MGKLRVDVPGGGKRGTSQKDEFTKELYQQQADKRAKSRIRKLIIENELRYHWVLTYAKNQENRAQSLEEFKYFMKKLNKEYGKKINYVATLEIQEKRKEKYGYAVIHFHLAIGEWIDHALIYENWGHGGVRVAEHTGELLKVAGYVAKYIGKQAENKEIRQREQKRYLSSKGLRQPTRNKLALNASDIEYMRANANFVSDYLDKKGNFQGTFMSGVMVDESSRGMYQEYLKSEEELLKEMGKVIEYVNQRGYKEA